MQNPKIIGRSPGGFRDENRADTDLVSNIFMPFRGENYGTLKVELFVSRDDEDRGGIVLRLLTDGDESNFIPACREVKDGVEIYLAGDGESRGFLTALKSAIATFVCEQLWLGKKT